MIRRTREKSFDTTLRFPTVRRSFGLVAAASFAALTGAACAQSETVDLDLTAAGERGQQVAVANGCQACHGGNWNGGVGPALVGLAGSTVTLDDDTTVVADSAYLSTAISDPAAQKTKGFTVVMPVNKLTADQVADIVTFIEELTPATP